MKTLLQLLVLVMRTMWEKAVTSVSMLLLSPEQLTSWSFDHLLQRKSFSEQIVALGLDKTHLVMDWGNIGFQESFCQIGLILRISHGSLNPQPSLVLPQCFLNTKPHLLLWHLVSNQAHSFLTTIQISAQMCILSFKFYDMALGAGTFQILNG